MTDHAMFLGVMQAAGDTSTAFSNLEVAKPLNDLNAPSNRGVLSFLPRVRAFGTFLPRIISQIMDETVDREVVLDITRGAWADTIDAAELFNEPGRFTTFVAYEYTSSSDDMGNLHRNVIFKGSEKLPTVPFSRFHSQNPEGLWDWMDDLRAQGIESLAIPHNSNGSNGQMFKWVDWAGDPIDNAYASATNPLSRSPRSKVRQRHTRASRPETSGRASRSHPIEWRRWSLASPRAATCEMRCAEGWHSRVRGSRTHTILVSSARATPITRGRPSQQGASLQRLQIIKGWVDAQGETYEEVYDVACSDGGAVDPKTHRCPGNGAKVDLADCSITGDKGAGQLRSLWRDPSFDLAATIQERAWSSPIQYSGNGAVDL